VKIKLLFALIIALWSVVGWSTDRDHMALTDAIPMSPPIAIPQSTEEAIVGFDDIKGKLDLILWTLSIINEDHYSDLKGAFVSHMAQIEEKIDAFEASVQDGGFDFEKRTAWCVIHTLCVNAAQLGIEALEHAQQAFPKVITQNPENL
jgi:hypothetical protein